MEEKITFPGDVAIDSLRIYNASDNHIDLTLAQATEILIYESVFASCMFGSIAFADADAIIETFPIVGGEALTIKLRTKTFEDREDMIIHKSFIIVGIEKRRLENDREQTYVLNFISIEGYNDLVNNIHQSFPGDTDSGGAFNTASIAENIFINYIAKDTPRIYGEDRSSGFTILGKHSSDLQYVSNGWTPFQNMNYIAFNATDANYPGADMVFFETNKTYAMASLQGMIATQEEVLFDQYFFPQMGIRKRTSNYGFSSPNLIEHKFNDIEEMKIPKTIDILEGNMNGYHASNIQAYDIYNKTRTHKNLDILNDFDDLVHTDTGAPIPQHISRSPTSYTNFKILNGNTYAGIATGIFDKGKKTSDERWVAAGVRRRQYFSSFNDYTFELDVPGRTDIECGVMIYLDYPSTQTKGVSDTNTDELLSGKYLVTAIAHKINIVTGHTMKMEIVKNGLGKSL